VSGRGTLDLHRGTVGKNFRDALHHFGGIVSHADDGVRPVLRRMLQHQFESIFARFLTELGQDGDIAANHGLESGGEISDNAARPYNNAPDDSVCSDNAISRQFIRGSNHARIHATHHRHPPWGGVYLCDSTLTRNLCREISVLLRSIHVETFFYFLSVVQIATGLYLVWQGLKWLGYARRRAMADPGFYAPRTAVLCSCKGLEPGLERNLTALTEFDHQNYEIFFVLAAESDPAHAIVKRVAATSRAKAHVVIADKPENCGEKVNNLRTALEQLPSDFEFLAFADSDGRPGKSWLKKLVAPLADARVGATTTMRWLIPNRANLPTWLLAAWNAPIVTMLGEKGKNFCWGGGMAIRRSVFDQIAVVEDWRNSVSDDYSLTRALQRVGRTIMFLPECLTLSYVETDFDGLLEFTNRQILITRVYAQEMWAFGFATHAVYCLTLVLGIFLTLGDVFATLPAFHHAVLTFLPVLLGMIRSSLRVAGVTEVLPAARSQIMSQSWIYILLTIFIPFLYVVNFVASLITRKIRWRSVTYELISPEQTRIIAN
jgi:ceramide glucosyltransferase